MWRISVVALTVLMGLSALPALADGSAPDQVTFVRGVVEQVLNQTDSALPGTDIKTKEQTIKVKILEGPTAGIEVTIDNDYAQLSAGQDAYFRHTTNAGLNTDTYVVSDPYRLPMLAFFIGIFLVALLIFGGKQGLRGLLSLVLSFILIAFVLLPGILAGYSPVLVSMGVASLIIILGSYITHGFRRTTTTAVIGMILTIIVTGTLAYFAVHWSSLTGYSSEESAYLNFNTGGSIDFVGLLLGSIMIGLLGVLYDAAIGQAIAVEELYLAGEHMTRAIVYQRALRIGREHIGALVNTLAIAYVGASLPLLLLVKASATAGFWVTINQEIFASEIVRIIIGSIGLVLAVPITTAVAVVMLRGIHAASGGHDHHGHYH